MRSASKRGPDDLVELSPDGGYKVRTYYPTMAQMKNFSEYIKLIHEDGGNRAGLAKIVPPAEYRPRKAGYTDDELLDREITSPIRQEVNGEKGLYQQLNIVERKKMTVRNFKKLAEDKHRTPEHDNGEHLERIFWKNVFTQPSIYGADVSGSLYDDDVEEFNLTRLNTILDDMNSDYGVTIQGVNTAYLYFGMWKTAFSWHTEDMDLYSINYLHAGMPKSWYTISPEHGKRFERLAASFFPHSFRTCKAFLRHKTTLISPAVLKKYSIPFSKCTQNAGEFMITFPYSYHSGYNHGFNIAEATNFALEYWIDFGKWATRCECSSESVRISMQTFVKRYQADRYEKWLQGKDICEDPRDRRHKAAAPKPTEYDLYLMGSHVLSKEDCDEKVRTTALQQNQSSNVKLKTKAARKAYPQLEEARQQYTEMFLKNESQYNSIQANAEYSHRSPTHNSYMIYDYKRQGPIDMSDCKFDLHEPKTFTEARLSGQTGIAPNYDQEVKEWQKKRKKKEQKEPKHKPKKEKKTREPLLPSRDLLQFLPLTFTHEKRFNRCIAAQPPHCSVCQLIELHPRDNADIWGDLIRNNPSNSNSTPQPEQTTSSHDDVNTGAIATPPLPATVFTAGKQVEEFKLPESSRVLLPRGVFNSEHFNLVSDETQLEAANASVREGDSGYVAEENKPNFLGIDLEMSELVQCSVCMLCVHTTCYGLNNKQISKDDWICDRCSQKNIRSLVNCELCPCRGGALKEFSKGVWIHITCALTVPNMKMTDLIKPDKSTDSPMKLPDNIEKSHCEFCSPSTALSKYIQGRCITCSGYISLKDKSWISCDRTFHPTCGHRNGVKFSLFDMHFDFTSKSHIRAACRDCQKRSPHIDHDLELLDNAAEDDSLKPIPVGTKVIARANNFMYYEGIVDLHQFVTYYEVFFPEASEFESGFTDRKIVDFDPDKKFNIGDPIQIKDSKEGVRTGKFKGSQEVEEYTIRFISADQSCRVEREKVDRRNIYLNLDELPEDLLRRYKGIYRRSFLEDCLPSAQPAEIDVKQESKTDTVAAMEVTSNAAIS